MRIVTIRITKNNLHLPLVNIRPFLLSLALLPAFATAADPEVSLVIKDHRFIPSEVKVPAGQKVKLLVDNQDATPEEFESHELNREKVIAPGAKATIFVGPLKPGRYPFVGQFNEKTARGVLISDSTDMRGSAILFFRALLEPALIPGLTAPAPRSQEPGNRPPAALDRNLS